KSVVSLSSTEILCDGESFLNFSSNDYLGLSQHPLLKERAIEYIQRYGVGSGASRLLSGNNGIYESIEKRLAELKDAQAALIFSSGYQLNATVLPALAGIAGHFLCDRFVHNSLLTGALASKASFHRFQHNNCLDLEQRLAKLTGRETGGWIVSESVFGMNGDLANLDQLERLSMHSGFPLFIDEAHATGVFGETGMGLVKAGRDERVIMGTFGKGCGSFGAYLACTEKLKSYLVNFCSGFIYTTALPPPVLGTIAAALEIIPGMYRERQYLHQLAENTRIRLKELGFDVGNSASQIIPIIVGTDANAVSLSEWLYGNQIFAPAIRPPTVPEGTARLRLSLSSSHREADIDKLINTLKQWQHQE
ncbi:MAG: 8-amino-7-oxononanoate synthase, partial [Candidatus Melainabacteria bacterium]